MLSMCKSEGKASLFDLSPVPHDPYILERDPTIARVFFSLIITLHLYSIARIFS